MKVDEVSVIEGVEAQFVEKHVNMHRRRSKARCEDRSQP